MAGLHLALIDLPDWSTPLRRIAGSAEKLAGFPPGEGDTQQDDRPDGRPEHDVRPAQDARPAQDIRLEQGS